MAPSILELCGMPPLENIQGKSFKAVCYDHDAAWRDAWFYEYNYEKQFPYTPNIRGIRTDSWKVMHYPHGDGSPDRHLAEMYDLKNDPLELVNLAEHKDYGPKRKELEARLATLLANEGLTPETDQMPIDEGIKAELPDQKIR